MMDYPYGVIRKVKANKRCYCDGCGKGIERGDEYMHKRFDGKTERYCEECAIKTDVGKFLFHPEIRVHPLKDGQRRLSEF